MAIITYYRFWPMFIPPETNWVGVNKIAHYIFDLPVEGLLITLNTLIINIAFICVNIHG
jgi:hypothetical protein